MEKFQTQKYEKGYENLNLTENLITESMGLSSNSLLFSYNSDLKNTNIQSKLKNTQFLLNEKSSLNLNQISNRTDDLRFKEKYKDLLHELNDTKNIIESENKIIIKEKAEKFQSDSKNIYCSTKSEIENKSISNLIKSNEYLQNQLTKNENYFSSNFLQNEYEKQRIINQNFLNEYENRLNFKENIQIKNEDDINDSSKNEDFQSIKNFTYRNINENNFKFNENKIKEKHFEKFSILKNENLIEDNFYRLDKNEDNNIPSPKFQDIITNEILFSDVNNQINDDIIFKNIEELIQIDIDFINFPNSFPSEIVTFEFEIKNISNINTFLELTFFQEENLLNIFKKYYQPDIKQIYENIPNSQNTFKCFTFSYFECEENIKNQENLKIEIFRKEKINIILSLNSPDIKNNLSLFACIEIKVIQLERFKNLKCINK